MRDKESIYTNDKIKELIKQRNELNRQIANEVEKEKAKYKFSWKRFLLMISILTLCISGLHFNKKLFPKTSIWSWEYYINK